MYSVETRTSSVAWKQYLYKFKSFSFVGLIILQLVVLFFSTSGTMTYGSGSGRLQLSVKVYASDIVIICTLVWISVKAFWLTKKDYKNMDFTFVTNRLSSSLSDIGLLFTLSIIGGFTSSLSSFLLRFVMYFTSDPAMIAGGAFKLPLPVLLHGLAAASLYMFLISGVAYLFGMLVEVNKLFTFVIPALLFGLARTQSPIFMEVFQFFSKENSLLLLTWKVLFLTGIFFVLSLMIYNRMEVRK